MFYYNRNSTYTIINIFATKKGIRLDFFLRYSPITDEPVLFLYWMYVKCFFFRKYLIDYWRLNYIRRKTKLKNILMMLWSKFAGNISSKLRIWVEITRIRVEITRILVEIKKALDLNFLFIFRLGIYEVKKYQ